MARRRKPEEPVEEVPVEVVETFPEPAPSLEKDLAPEQPVETKRPKEPVRGYMRDFYGHY